MGNKLMVAGVAAAICGAAAAGAGAAGTTKCGDDGTTVSNIRASRVSCKTARRLVRADLQGQRHYGWKCHFKPYNATTKVTCTHKGSEKITFQVTGRPATSDKALSVRPGGPRLTR